MNMTLVLTANLYRPIAISHGGETLELTVIATSDNTARLTFRAPLSFAIVRADAIRRTRKTNYPELPTPTDEPTDHA